MAHNITKKTFKLCLHIFALQQHAYWSLNRSVSKYPSRCNCCTRVLLKVEHTKAESQGSLIDTAWNRHSNKSLCESFSLGLFTRNSTSAFVQSLAQHQFEIYVFFSSYDIIVHVFWIMAFAFSFP